MSPSAGAWNAEHGVLVRRPYDTSLELVEPPDGRPVSVDIGPFEDQADLLHFAMLLETAPGIGHIDLIEAEPENALFIVRAGSAGEVAALLNRLPDYTITSTAFGNMVAAKIERRRRAAAGAPYIDAVSVPAEGPAWWRRAALAVALGAAAAGVLFVAFNGVPRWRTSTPPLTASPTTAVAIPTTFVPPSATASVAPVIPAVLAPTPSPALPSATPGAAPTASATPAATPSATPTPVRPVTTRYHTSFSTSLGTIRALNACVWDTPIDGSLILDFTRNADGSVAGTGALEGVLTYSVTETPPTATCRSSEVNIAAEGGASGAGTVNASLSGARGLAATFDGQLQNGAVVGSLTISRDLSTTSSFGDTNETRSVTVSGLTLN